MLTRLVYGAYTALLWLALPLVWIRLLRRGRHDPAYRARRGERFGAVPAHVPAAPVWFHAVSAGEAIGAAPLIRALGERHPSLPLLVTTMTPTGADAVQRLLPDRVSHCYAPYDFGFAVRRFLDRIRPRLLVLMETELWPKLIAECARRDVAVVVINARLSARSARGYRRIAWLVRPMLANLRWVACQYPDHVTRFIELGLPAERAAALGSVKFDAVLPADRGPRVAALQGRWDIGARPVWIAASTHAGEDEQMLAAHRRLRERVPDALLLLVPRHPQRFDRAFRLAAQAGFRVARLGGDPEQNGSHADVLIGDVMGELIYLYGLAQVAFVGGSLVPHGGHNPIEPALWGLPVMMGPHRANFEDVAGRFAAAGCLHTVDGAESLAAALAALLPAPEQRAVQAEAALRVVADNRGATTRLLLRLDNEIELAAPAPGAIEGFR